MGTPLSVGRKSFGHWLRDKRRSEHLTQKEVAHKMGFSISRLKRIECGYDPVTIRHVFDFCDVYGISLDSFLVRLELAEPELVDTFREMEDRFSKHLLGKARHLLRVQSTDTQDTAI